MPFLKTQNAKQSDVTIFVCGNCDSKNLTPYCFDCAPDDVILAVHDLMKDILDDDEGKADMSTQQRLMRVHKIWDIL